MESEFRPISGKTLDSFLEPLSRALKDSGVILKSEDGTERTGDRHVRGALKVHFCIGINNVTRTLERMPKKEKKGNSLSQKLATSMVSCEEATAGSARGKPIKLQAIIVAMDVQPKILVSHIGDLCISRGIPMVSIIGGDGMGSLRLGKTFGLRTATVIGVKARGLQDGEVLADGKNTSLDPLFHLEKFKKRIDGVERQGQE